MKKVNAKWKKIAQESEDPFRDIIMGVFKTCDFYEDGKYLVLKDYNTSAFQYFLKEDILTHKVGDRHREDGPAVVPFSHNYKIEEEYYLEGKYYSKEAWEKDPRVKKAFLRKKIQNILE